MKRTTTKQLAPTRAATPKRIGRPPIPYDPDIAAFICSEVAAGSNLNRLTQERDDLPSLETIYRWLRESAAFGGDYTRARETRADSRADKIDDITDRTLRGELDPHAARVAIDAIKWQAGKENPKRYGDHQQIDLNVSTTVDDALAAGRRRLAASTVIDADVGQAT